jgi:hypothetical protein
MLVCLALATGLSTRPRWIEASGTGCRIWDPQPEPNETVTFSGACTDGLASGPGTVQWYENGSVAEREEGTLERGHLEGPGTQTYANGDQFTGNFINDQHFGAGRFVSVRGWTYVGGFASGKFEGQGTMTWKNGTKYVGQFKNGHRTGFGTITYPDGRTYSGQFLNGRLQR